VATHKFKIMMFKYVYQNIKTGKKLFTNEKKDSPDLKLIREIKNGLDYNKLMQKNVC